MICLFEYHYTNLTQLENNGVKYDDSTLGEGLQKVKDSPTLYEYLKKEIYNDV